ncbi:Arylacetamide deacetylase [Hondaea fermentalgiana]|uniref:Arylacetamide deacetylase n=1 Tax=Hondaea fermentalgiana TaxID=2315210 RepID=A0A2R5G2F7_9STRA|nr:Arylacetamide deacetylase [Hondaea fermentalgiana]|eukprot:GBG23908.1 Arylacetamide deacetylase [Hondaea fermentalgiana]
MTVGPRHAPASLLDRRGDEDRCDEDFAAHQNSNAQWRARRTALTVKTSSGAGTSSMLRWLSRRDQSKGGAAAATAAGGRDPEMGDQDAKMRARIDASWDKLQNHPDIDERFKRSFMRAYVLAAVFMLDDDHDFTRREQLVEKRGKDILKLVEFLGKEEPPVISEEALAVARDDGVSVSTREIVSQPDGNSIKLSIVEPEAERAADRPLPCVVYMHGGGMASNSAFDPSYQTIARMLAREGVVVVVPDFRNCEVPTASNPEVAPFPAGLNDCYSALKWVHDNKEDLGIDDRIMVAGESGGGNLALAIAIKAIREGERDLVQHGVYSMCPYIAGQWPQDVKNNGILGTSHLDSENNNIFLYMTPTTSAAMGYNLEAFKAKDPLAWPVFATDEDLAQFPRTVIQVEEFDPLRDEGILFYRRLARNGVRATCKQNMGAIHGSEIMPQAAIEIPLDTCASIAAMARSYPLE